MKYCSECGTKISGRYCSECGAESGKVKNKKTIDKPATGVLDFDFGKYVSSLSSMLTVQTNYDEKGKLSDEDIQKITSGLGFQELISDLNEQNAVLSQKIKSSKEKNKAAIVAISNNKCPDCGEPFRTRQNSCKNCGALLDISIYEGL